MWPVEESGPVISGMQKKWTESQNPVIKMEFTIYLFTVLYI